VSAPIPERADPVGDGRLGGRRLGVFALIGACLVMDGFDVQAIGYVAPALIRDWGIRSADMAPVFGAGLLGLFLGSLLLGMAADRLGRRPVLLGATAFFSVFTLLTGHAGSLAELVALRFLAGLGLGAIMPNATALVGEYSPGRLRVASMMIVTNGFLVGAMLGGFLAAWLIPARGWRAVFTVGGIVPLALLVPMFLWLPESRQFLALRGRRERIAVPIPRLFRRGRAAGTALLWVANFTNVLTAYFVASWLPTVVRDAGHPTRTAVLVGTAVQAGGAIGTLAMGLLMQRTGFVPVLTACFAGAALNLALVGQPGLPLPLLFAAAFLAGWGIFGGQPGLNALAATYYPTDLRSTGIGAALGVGRFGAILGPVVAGALLARQWTGQELFQAAAGPALVSTAVVLALRRVLGPRGEAAGTGPDLEGRMQPGERSGPTAG
jgi:AAHS family 4-hydroxybenzoate transporter-like MFS transporter